MADLDHRSLDWAVEIIGMCEPIRCHQGGMWFGSNQNFADATFVDYGAADAFAVAAKAVPIMAKALQDIAHQMLVHELAQEFGDKHADDYEGAYEAIIKIARQAIAAVGTPPESSK